MTAPQVVQHAAKLGIVLWREGDSLAYRGPADKLTKKILQRLAEMKPALLPVLPLAPPVHLEGVLTAAEPPEMEARSFAHTVAKEPRRVSQEAKRAGELLASALALSPADLNALGPWKRSPGVSVPDLRLWLDRRIEQRASLIAKVGREEWLETPLGQRTAEELFEFAEWFETTLEASTSDV
jgi:hypothetical protein